MSIASSIENKIYFSKYKADSKIGQGSFGKIYAAHNINNGELYALKLEKRNGGGRSLLETETYILCYLKGEGIPSIKSYGFSGEFNILVMELLGKSLETLFQENNCKFSLKTVCMLADQMITRLEYIHKKYILHRDIKPDNFTIGRGKQSHIIYLIDFGLSKKYRSSKGNHEHIKYSENKRLIGTARYASINALKGCEQGRRDDMEALGYVLMYFLRGSLPWQGLKLNKGDDRYKKIYETKKSTTPEELCVGYPRQFCEYVKYTRSLSFEQEPDYNYLKKLIYNVMDKYEFSIDYLYDWGLNKRKSCQITYDTPNNINISNNNINKLCQMNTNHNTTNGSNNAVENKNVNVNPNQKPSTNLNIVKNKKRSNINNKRNGGLHLKKSDINKRINNNELKFNKTYLPNNRLYKKNFIKININSIKKKTKARNNNIINSMKNQNNFIKNRKILKKENQEFNMLDILLMNESYMSAGTLANEWQNINCKHLNNSKYKFLSELNSTSKKKREYENKIKKINELKSIENNNKDNNNKESKDNKCIII